MEIVPKAVRARMLSQQSQATPTRNNFDYVITYAEDGTLKWEPAANSKALAIALSYHFPTEKDLETKMRAAIRKFVEEDTAESPQTTKFETQFIQPTFQKNVDDASEDALRTSETRRVVTSLPAFPIMSGEVSKSSEVTARSSLATTTSSGAIKAAPLRPSAAEELRVLTWDPEASRFKGSARGTKRRYEKVEASKVAANRGNACEEHRRQKAKCDPDLCPRNGQNAKEIHPSLAGLNSTGDAVRGPNSSILGNSDSESFGETNMLDPFHSANQESQDLGEILKAESIENSLKSTVVASEKSMSTASKDCRSYNTKATLEPITKALFHVSRLPDCINDMSFSSREVDAHEAIPWWLQDELGLDPGDLFDDVVQAPEKHVGCETFSYTDAVEYPKLAHKESPSNPKSLASLFQSEQWADYDDNYGWEMQSALTNESKHLALGDAYFSPIFDVTAQSSLGIKPSLITAPKTSPGYPLPLPFESSSETAEDWIYNAQACHSASGRVRRSPSVEAETVLSAPHVVNIRKGQAKKFNWKKGGQTITNSDSKGFKVPFASVRQEQPKIWDNNMLFPEPDHSASTPPGSPFSIPENPRKEVAVTIGQATSENKDLAPAGEGLREFMRADQTELWEEESNFIESNEASADHSTSPSFSPDPPKRSHPTTASVARERPISGFSWVAPEWDSADERKTSRAAPLPRLSRAPSDEMMRMTAIPLPLTRKRGRPRTSNNPLHTPPSLAQETKTRPHEPSTQRSIPSNPSAASKQEKRPPFMELLCCSRSSKFSLSSVRNKDTGSFEGKKSTASVATSDRADREGNFNELGGDFRMEASVHNLTSSLYEQLLDPIHELSAQLSGVRLSSDNLKIEGCERL